MYNKRTIFLSLTLIVIFGCCAQGVDHKQSRFVDFLKSFVHHYEFGPEGRYTHEYHGLLLDETAKSFDQLEDRLKGEGFSLVGRSMIVGYEENAVPTYYTNYRLPQINDEATLRNNVGWSMKLHNRFGFMTGFLFKDFNVLSQQFFSAEERVFNHINAEQIPIFDNRASIFQEHAFGEAFPLIIKAQNALIKSYKEKDFSKLLTHLKTFWQLVYDNSLKVGNQQVAGTQDILFSIAYADHLIRSNLPCFNYFTGPDITYPIEVTCKHDREVSRHAQAFTKDILTKLNPVDDKPTVYVFCSFVDGVGKSTTLGNIKNGMKFGDDIDKFKHVDNSSSQLAELFKFKDNVFIADLPAQISHFTYKPDGLVYVDARTEYSEKRVLAVLNNFRENRDEYLRVFHEREHEVVQLIKTVGLEDPKLNSPDEPEYAFIKNVTILKKRTGITWIPFKYENKYYLIRESQPEELRVLVPLGDVKSEGLKNIEAEQMLFFNGIRFPLPYNHFLDDLVSKLKKSGIENVVFVDFMSMYPRSSRENVRINYLLQQVAHLYQDFNPSTSLYKDFVSGGELLRYLLDPQKIRSIFTGFEYEVLVRYALHELIVERKAGSLDGKTLSSLTPQIQEKIKKISPHDYTLMIDFLEKKIKHEKQSLENVFGSTKDFVNIQQFSFDRLQAFINCVNKFFCEDVLDDHTSDLWELEGEIIVAPGDEFPDGPLGITLETNEGTPVKALYKFNPDCRAPMILTQFLRDTRVKLYAALANILTMKRDGSGKFTFDATPLRVPPVYLKKGTDGAFYLVEKKFKMFPVNGSEIQKFPFDLFKVVTPQSVACTAIDEIPYRLDWTSRNTAIGLLGFGANQARDRTYGTYSPVVYSQVCSHQKEKGSNKILPTSLLYSKMSDSYYWKMVKEHTLKQAEKNSIQAFKNMQTKKSSQKYKKSLFDRINEAKKKKPHKGMMQGQGQSLPAPVIFATHSQRESARQAIKMLATLEMVIKDPESDVAVRFGNKDDFVAALKIYEEVVFPTFLRVTFDQPLFKDYNQIEPFPSWDFWESLEA